VAFCRMRLGLLAFASVALAPAANMPQITDLSPSAEFFLAKSINQPPWQHLIVREMRVSSAGIWFLIDSKVQRGLSAIVATNPTGGVITLMPAPSGTSLGGLTVTSAGVATLILRPRSPAALTEYAPSGAQVGQWPVSCYASENLLSIGGRPSTICGNGLITKFGQGAPRETSSWARPGSKFEVVEPHTLAVIDRSTLGIVMNDLSTGAIAVGASQVPEFSAALNQTAQQRAAYKVSATQGPLGDAVLAMDTASDGSAWYVLVFPYPVATGPTVVKLDSAGQPLARFRCHVPSGTEVLTQVEAQNGSLTVSTAHGNVLTYKEH